MKRLALYILCIWGICGAIEVNDLNIAIIWNNSTDSRLAPRGWKVGEDATNSGLDTTIGACPAPEIGKAQLKILLSSYERSVSFDSTLDTTAIPNTLFNQNGLPDGIHQGKFKKIRIYDKSSMPLTLADIKEDFMDVNPDAIIYINAGAEWVKPGDDDGGLYQLLRDAADSDIGIMTIGDASLIDARNIDPDKTRFPVMGVQKTYRFKAYSSDPKNDNDTIREFNFLSDNDSIDNGVLVWEKPDTVILHSNYNPDENNSNTAEYWIETKDGKEIYRGKGVKTTGAGNQTISMDPNIKLKKEDILHAYGEWSINAKAVEVMDEDLYAPEMAAGVYPNHDLILTGQGWDGAVPAVSEKAWGEVMWVNGVTHAGLSTALPAGDLFGTGSGTNFTFDKDYVVGKPNIDDNTKIDSILVIQKGVKVVTGEDVYADTYYAGGYKDLKIMLFGENDTKNIFEDVFPKLKAAGITELKFKPWTKGGRIKAAADIWAVNEKLTLKDFDNILSDGFDPTAYYRAYLGDQVAGAKGYPHFVKPPKPNEQFSKSRQDSLGYDQNGKLYHVISAIQNGHRRMVMLGFQPSYLADLEAVLDLLEDATKWIAIDDYKLPPPTIIPIEDGVELTPADNQKIYTDQDSIKLEIDFTKKGIVLHETAFKVSYVITYGSQNVVGSVEFEADDGLEHIEDTIIDLSSLITIDPSVTADTDVIIKAVSEPSFDKAPFDHSDTTVVTLRIRKLTSEFDKGTNNQIISFKGTYNEKIKSDTTIYGDVVSDVKISYSKDGGAWQQENATYEFDTDQAKLDIVATAIKDRYINSDTLKRTYKKEDLSLPTPEMNIKASSVNGTGDYLFSVDTVLFMGLESYDVAGVPVTDEDYDLAFKLSGSDKTMPDTGLIDLPFSFIDDLIDDGHKALVIEDAIAESEKTDTWKNSSAMDKQTYEFRTVDLDIQKVSGDDDDTDIKITFTAKDPITGTELSSAKIYYTLDGSDANESSTGPVSSSDQIDVENGVTVNAIAVRSGYIDGTDEVSYTKDVYIKADPESGTFFGESLEVELSSNHQPILYKIDGGSTVTINGTSGTFTLNDDEVSTLIRDNDTVVVTAWIEASGNINEVTETFTYYRRKLPDPVVKPASGKYSGNVDVTMSIAVDDKYDADIYYATKKDVTTSETKYVGQFTVSPDITLYAKAFAEDWLPSDSVIREYERVLVSESGSYYDANADGIIDSAVIELDTIIEGLGFPDSIVATLPVVKEVVTIKGSENFSFNGNQLCIKIDKFNTVLTGFSKGDYIKVYGDRYDGSPVSISDKVAPVIGTARYTSGEYEADTPVRDADTLMVTFTEEVEDIEDFSEKILFNFKSAKQSYTADVSLMKKVNDKEFLFTVEDLHGVTYPSRGDSIWINIAQDVPEIVDTRENIQREEENRKVEMIVGKLDIQVVMKCYWIDRNDNGFEHVTTADDIVTPVGGFTTFDIPKGALITIDPLMPYLESEVGEFDVKLKILDAVGNVVAEVSEMGEGEHIKALPAEMVVNDDGEKRLVIAVAWDGNNIMGRNVHRRTFKVVAVTRWPNIDDEIVPKPALLPVMREDDSE